MTVRVCLCEGGEVGRNGDENVWGYGEELGREE